MHNRKIGRDDLLKIEVRNKAICPIYPTNLIDLLQWARTPPSASWRFDSGRDPRGSHRERSPRRGRSISPPRRRDYSPRKESRRDRDRDYDRRDRDRSRSPDDRDREMKDVRDPRDDEDDRDRDDDRNGDDRKGENAEDICEELIADIA